MKRIVKEYLPLILFLIPVFANSQVVYEGTDNVGIYEFLDELANLKVIEINSAVKPYSRKFISEKLLEVKEYPSGQTGTRTSGSKKKKFQLNRRQLKELEFYWQDYQLDLGCQMSDARKELGMRNEEGGMRKDLEMKSEPDPGSQIADCESDCSIDYDHKLGFLFKKQSTFAVPLNPLAFQYKDRLFTLSVRPILGITYSVNENGSALHKYWGGSAFGYIGRNFGFYANLRDNNESTALSIPQYFTLREGHVYKGNPKGGVDYFEMKGGVTASWNWGSIGLLNDRFSWGNNYHGANILSDKAPPYPFIYLNLNPVKWLQFSYIHGWLNSHVIDSTRSFYDGDVYRVVYRNKYIAANMFTVIPWIGLNLSFGNSIIYSDINVNPLYLIPFMFFNAVDATKNSYNNDGGSNSQIFFDLSVRMIRHLHVYATLFVDELKMSRVTDPDLYNFTSWKAGLKLSDFPVRNLSFVFEWTKTNPMTYKHYISTTSFASNGYCLGHYLRDNSFEYYFSLAFKPLRGLLVTSSLTLAAHGGEYSYSETDPVSDVQIPFMDEKTWQNTEFSLRAIYEYSSRGYFFLEYLNTSRQGNLAYQPHFMHGKTNTIIAGVNLGL